MELFERFAVVGAIGIQAWEIGVFGVVVLLLGITAWLLLIKERAAEDSGSA